MRAKRLRTTPAARSTRARDQAAHFAAAAIGQMIFMVVASRRSSIWMSMGAGSPAIASNDTGTNCGGPFRVIAAELTGTPTGPLGNRAAPSRLRASLRQPCTRFAFRPCAIVTFATDATDATDACGAAHRSSTRMLNCTLCRLRETTLSAAIVST